MGDITNQHSRSAVPCALKHCLPHEHDAQALAALSGNQRQTGFQYWAEYTRTASPALSSDIFAKEDLICPLLRCRTRFRDVSSNLRHIPSCPWLPDAWYWCPYCCRPERFMDCESKSPANLSQNKIQVETLFRHAATFSMSFGRNINGSSMSSSLFSPDSTTGRTSASVYGPDQRLELDDTSGDMSRPVELDSTNVHEKHDKVQWVAPESDISPLGKKYMPITTSSPVRVFERPARAPPLIPKSVSSDCSFTAVSVQSGNNDSSNHVIDIATQSVNPHFSLSQGSPTLCRVDARAPSLHSSRCNTANLRVFPPHAFNGPQLPPSTTQGTSVPRSSAYNAAKSLGNKGEFKSHAYIVDLCDVVCIMSKDWIRRLATSNNIPQLHPEQYSRALFELGIGALRNYFRGATPSSFQDIFALMHVAMACSRIVHENDRAYSWSTFLEEACQWQHLLSNVIEKSIFVKAMGRLCRPQGPTTSSSFKDFAINNNFLPTEHAVLVRLIDRLSSGPVAVAIEEEGDKDRQHFTANNEQSILPGKLQSSIIIRGCMEFLDNFGHAVIVEDLTSRQINSSRYVTQHAPGIETLDSNIFGRLHKWEGLEAFHGVVSETHNMLRCGLLHSAREVEVMLIFYGRSHSKSAGLLRRFLEVVTDLCDTVMKEWGLKWRNHFYDIILETVLATVSEFSWYRGHALQIPSATIIGSKNGSYNAGTPTDNAAMPRAELDASSSSSPCTLQTSSAPRDDASHCPRPSCNASFTGSSQRTNLERHLRTALHHNQDARFKCEFCLLPFSRLDNLQQHLRNIHDLDPVLKAQRKTSRGVGA